MRPWRNQHSSPWQRFFLTVLGLGLLALVVHTLFSEHGYLAVQRHQQEYERLQQELQALQEENQRLEEEIKALKSDPRAIERVAREDLKMARPGEKVYSLPQGASETPTQKNPPKKKR